jgi:hypothetical protein
LFIVYGRPFFGRSAESNNRTDFNTIGDDGQVAVMAAQLYAAGEIDLLGFTIASGNEWRDQEVVECLKAVDGSGLKTG